MAVSVQFEIGHTAKLRAKKTHEGFTHDWELYVRGANNAEISAYVEKVVFNLHESFQKPKRVYKEPPYVVNESGYASFVLTVDIHFRNRDEPKRVQYPYDLDLKPHGPPHHRSEERRFVFENPSEEFRQKLLKGGGVPVVPAGMTGSRSGHPILAPSSFGEANANNVQQSSSSVSSKHKNSGSTGDGSKKHKSRSDDTKHNSFANLFSPPDPSIKTSNSKSIADLTKSQNSSSSNSVKTLSPNAPSGISNAGTASLKDKPVKEVKDKHSNNSSAEKSKDKSERKEKHKSSSTFSPNKDGRGDGKKSSISNVEGSKSEKPRTEDKPKKDKNREKDRERSSSSATSKSSNLLKPVTSSSNTVSSAPLQRTSTHVSANSSSASRSDDKIINMPIKSDKETKDKHVSSSSSSKKSKKDKKDKDKDREKDKDKEKRDDKQRGSHDSKSKEDRSHSSASQSNISGSPSGQSTPNSLQAVQAHSKTQISTLPGTNPNNVSTKKLEKDGKSHDGLKSKSSDKSAEKAMTEATSMLTAAISSTEKKSAPPNSSNSAVSTSKSHKHKKKDKNKEKDKEKERVSDKDKDKTKEKHKEKSEDKKDAEKPSEAMTNKSTIAAAVLDTKKAGAPNQPSTVVASSAQTQLAENTSLLPGSNTVESTVSNKKSQSKEKKSKESKSNKEAKRRSEPTSNSAPMSGESKSKISKTSTPLSTAGSNIELSDADSRQSAHENVIKIGTAVNSGTTAAELHSDSSYSSFPDISVKSKEKLSVTPTGSGSEKNVTKLTTASLVSKENKRDKEGKSLTKSSEKTSKQEKDDKKRRRNTVTSENKFIEPPVKQAKKEQNKSASTGPRDNVKSPLPSRSNSISANNVKPTKSISEASSVNAEMSDNPQAAALNSSMVVSTTAISTATPANSSATSGAANHTIINNANNVTSQRNNSTIVSSSTHPTSPALSSNDALCPNLSELQELHHKIMTLQDNQDLQQIVEMIAASGCYELTQRTFDFDLCKLDRSTVERLQEFFATSVS